MNTVLVTGASGFIARAVVSELQRRGLAVRTADRGAVRSSEDPLANVEHHQVFDLRDPLPAGVLDGVGTVIHLAGIADRRGVDEEHLHQVNVRGTERLIAAAVQGEVDHFIFASSVFVHGDAADMAIDVRSPLRPLDAYARCKLDAERALLRHVGRLDVSILRLPLVLTDQVPRAGLAERIARLPAVVAPSPRNRRSFIQRDELAAVIADLVQHRSGSTIRIPQPTGEIGFEDVVRAAAQQGDRAVRILRVPRGLFRPVHSVVRAITGQSIAGLHADLIARASSRPVDHDVSVESLLAESHRPRWATMRTELRQRIEAWTG